MFHSKEQVDGRQWRPKYSGASAMLSLLVAFVILQAILPPCRTSTQNKDVALCSNASDQVELLQMFAPNGTVRAHHAEKLGMLGKHHSLKTEETCCSAEDDEKLAYIQSELDSMYVWDIEDEVEQAMEISTRELEEEYNKVVSGEVTCKTSWTDRLKTAGSAALKMGAQQAVKAVPYVGGVLSSVVKAFWPSSDNSCDIWELMLGQVQELIDVSIMKSELISRYADLLAVKRFLNRFSSSRSNIDRGNFLGIALAKVEDVMEHLTVSENRAQFIPLAVVAATLHCTILRVRVLVGMDLYGAWDASWNAELQEAVAYYQDGGLLSRLFQLCL